MNKLLDPTIDEVVDIWCKELESGQYKQCTGRLCRFTKDDTKSFCCLGVLTDIFQKNVGGLEETIKTVGAGKKAGLKYISYGQESIILPSVVRKWAKMNDDAGRYDDKHTLWEDNDVRKKTFPEIAQIIRDNKDSLFVKRGEQREPCTN